MIADAQRDAERTVEYQQQAQEIGDRVNEAMILRHFGNAYVRLEDYGNAVACQ